MKKLAVLLVMTLEIAVCGCGGNTTSTTTSTSTAGNWEAHLIDGTGQASLLNFVAAFNVTNSGPLDFTGFAFFNNGACFATGLNAESENGTATLTTSSADKVTGTLTMTITSKANNNVLSLNGNLTGTSNGTTGTTGTLSNGVVVGTWSLTGGAGDPSCNVPSGTFTMCQNPATGTGTCPAPTT